MSDEADPIGASSEPVDIVVVTYNRIRYLKECVRSILENTSYPYGKLIVVDNHSEDGTVGWLRKQADKGKLLPVFCDRNLGRPGALNRGVAETDTEIVAISDDDAWYNPGWLRVSMRILELWPEVAVASVDHRRTVWLKGHERRKELAVDFRTTLRTYHLVFRKAAILKAGGFGTRGGQLLGSATPWTKMQALGWKVAKLAGSSEGDRREKQNQERGNNGLTILPFTELGNAEFEGVDYVTHMAHASHPKSHHDYYEKTGYKEFAYRAKRIRANRMPSEFTPKR